MHTEIDSKLAKLKDQLQGGKFESLETEWLEIKPVPPSQRDWDSISETICAFLNTRGGVLLLGVKEIGRGNDRRYELTGWQEDAENKLKSLKSTFRDFRNELLDVSGELGLLSDQRRSIEIREVMNKPVALLYVSELQPENKPCFYHGTAYRRVGTGDQKLDGAELDHFQMHYEEARRGSELRAVEGTSMEDVDLDKLNQYITLVNRQIRHETFKSSVADGESFLRRKSFLLESGALSTLGYLVCGRHPEDRLGFICQVHAFLQLTQPSPGSARLADDKKIITGSVIDLMEDTITFILQKLQVAVSASGSGKAEPEFPEALLRETVNNALAHRDYVIDKPVSIWVRPGREVEIRNPGCFRKGQLIEKLSALDPVRRVAPDPRPRNPKLAQTLSLFNKWEGQGIGMSTLVNLCLDDRIDLPIYRIQSHSEVTLFLRSGKLVDDEMLDLFKLYDKFISKRLRSRELRDEERVVLSYIIKARRADEHGDYSIVLTRDNNHFHALANLERVDLIRRHSESNAAYAVYVPNPEFLRDDFDKELEQIFGSAYVARSDDERRVLNECWKHEAYSSNPFPSARSLALHFSHQQSRNAPSKRFEDVYRQAKRSVERLRDAEFLIAHHEKTKQGKLRLVGYQLNHDFAQPKLPQLFKDES